MALTLVRVRLGETWHTLRYDPERAVYLADIVPEQTSRRQPGGYFDLLLEAVDEAGSVVQAGGADFPALRLTVNERTPPVLTLVSPAQGYLTNPQPAIVLTAHDEALGSGVDITTLQARLDGVPVVCETAQEGEAYRITIQAPEELTDGPHSLSVAVCDFDGNKALADFAWLVDTAPPLVWMLSPERYVVDAAQVLVSGLVLDRTAPPITVTVKKGAAEEKFSLPSGGRFACALPLEVGDNYFTVTAVDSAGLETVESIRMIRLVTDRTQADVTRAAELARKANEGTITPEEWAEYAAGPKGAYTAADLNRVGAAEDYLVRILAARGILVQVSPRMDWTDGDSMPVGQAPGYLAGVAVLREAAPIPEKTPQVPQNLEGATVGTANDIETILTCVETFLPLTERIYCGEFFCGEV